MRAYLISTLCVLAGLVLSTQAQAYMGPGAGLSAIGSFFSVIAAFFFALVGFVWYPVRRLLRKRASPGPDGGK
jgi:ATP/ADP translocase